MDIVNKIFNENCLTGLKNLPDNSIDCCVTSPPYWGLRNYGISDQFGNEKHFKEFITNLLMVFVEVKRVLKDNGTCFINLGDTYNGYKLGNDDLKNINANSKDFKKEKTELPNKCLCMIPERFSIEMINNGWCLRNQIIWHKPNQMPSSATDRFTVDFEKIFFYVKNPSNYYFEQQLEKSIWADFDKRSLIKGGKKSKGKTAEGIYATKTVSFTEGGMRNVRTLWSVCTEPNEESHFAMYPQKLVERMIKSGCPENGIVLDPFMGGERQL
jgi:site-specific DNA-methyltransferase (adenine-specific)